MFQFLFLMLSLCACSTQDVPRAPEPRYTLNFHKEALVLTYQGPTNTVPENLRDLDIKIEDRIKNGRTSRHIYFPMAEKNTQNYDRIKFLKKHLLKKGVKVFKLKEDPSITNIAENTLPLTIYVYHVLPPHRDSTMHAGDPFAQKVAMMTNELYMLEDVAILFDHSPTPDIDARYSIRAVESYAQHDEKPKGTNTSEKDFGGLNILGSLGNLGNLTGGGGGALSGILGGGGAKE